MLKMIAFQIVFILFIGKYAITDNNHKQYIDVNKNICFLTHLRTFPKEDATDGFIVYPSQLSLDKNGFIYVCDMYDNSIKVYNNNCEFIKKIGRKGEGPGEFLFPSKIAINKNMIIIHDNQNMRIQFLNINGEYLYSFKVLNGPQSFTFSEDEIFMDITSESKRFKKIISVFDYKGRLKRQFGEYLAFSPNLASSMSDSFIKYYNNKIYVAFMFYPILRIYNKNNILLKEAELNEMNYKNLVPENYKWRLLKKHRSVIPSKYLFRGMAVNEDGIFLGLYHRDIIIDQYDFDLNFIQRYCYKHKGDKSYYLFDFEIVKKKNNQYVFYVLDQEDRKGGLAKVDVFSTKSVSEY